MSFGARLRRLLDVHSMSQKALAEALEVAPSTITNWVRDIYEPPKAKQERIAEMFGIDRQTLLFGELPAEPKAANG